MMQAYLQIYPMQYLQITRRMLRILIIKVNSHYTHTKPPSLTLCSLLKIMTLYHVAQYGMVVRNWPHNQEVAGSTPSQSTFTK